MLNTWVIDMLLVIAGLAISKGELSRRKGEGY